MDDCCSAKESELRGLVARQGKILRAVLVINLVMFFVEAGSSFLAGSTALLADSLDMLGDAFVYGASLYSLGKTARWTASVAALKGALMTLFGLGVVFEAVRRFNHSELPVVETMGTIGTLALLANLGCALLLYRHREDDINMRSTWLCSRNDVIANLAVLVAAGLVSFTHSKYPDLVVGVLIAALVLHSAAGVLWESLSAIRRTAA